MADDQVPEDAMFDPSLKKKKKKKKGALDLDEALGGEAAAPTEAAEEPAAAATDASEHKSEQTKEDNLSDDQLDDDFGKKKKKKKKKITFDMTPLGESLPADEAEEASADAQLDQEFDKMVKKKKKSPSDAAKVADVVAPEASASAVAASAWAGTDRDYTYDELLTRVFDIMREKNPDIVGGDRKKLVLRPPQVVRIGTRKTSFVNFHDIAKLLHRQPKHLLAYLLSELGTVGNIDGNNQLIIKGRFQPKHIENVLRRYIKEYVSCHTCKSPDTQLQKDTRLFFLQCQTCGSRCSVANIKSGFQAVTGRRAAIRARTT